MRSKISILQSLRDFAILRLLNLSQNQANFSQERAYFRNCHKIFKKRKVVSQFEKWNEQPCVLIMLDLQELHRTNEPKAERIRATRLGYAAQTVYLSNLISLSNLVRSIQIRRRNLLKLWISEQTPLMWKPGKILFNKHKSPPFTMDLT